MKSISSQENKTSWLPIIVLGMLAAMVPFFAKPLVALGAAAALFVGLVIVRNPRIGLLLIVISIPLETAGHVGRLIGNLPLTIPKILTLVTLVAWLINFAMHKIRFRSLPWMFLLPAFWVTCCVSLAGASEMRAGAEAIFRFATTIIFFFLIVQLLDSKKILTWCLIVFTVASTAAASQSLIQRFMPQSSFQFRHGWEEAESRRSGVEQDIVEQKMVGIVNRSSGLSLHSILLALNVSLLIAPISSFLANARKKEVPKKIFWLGLLAISLASIVVSYARTGLLLLLFCLFLMLLTRQLRITPAKLVILFVIISIGFLALPSKYKKRVFDPQSYTLKSNSITTRLEAQHAVFRQFLDHPILGVGYGNRYGIFDYYTTYSDKKHAVTPHNAYLQVAAQVGFIGLFLLCLFFLKVHSHTRKAIIFFRDQNDPDFARLGNALNISMLVFLFSGLALDLFDKGFPQIWLITGLCTAYICLAYDKINSMKTV